MNLDIKAFLAHKDLKLVIFSYMTGAELYHKISLLDKKIRKMLPGAGLLDQTKILVFKNYTRP